MPEEATYIDYSPAPQGSTHEDGTLVLNRYSTVLTRGHDSPAAQVASTSSSYLHI